MTRADEREQPSQDREADESPQRLTRKGVADVLGVSIFKVRSMEDRELHPNKVDGIHYFDAEEVAAVARRMAPKHRRSGERTAGEIAALAFQAFDDGQDLHQIVTELRIPPEKVRALYREWREPDLEQHELALRKQARLKDEQRRHEQEMASLERNLARLARLPKG
jgi:muconolactone delta-isomerase